MHEGIFLPLRSRRRNSREDGTRLFLFRLPQPLWQSLRSGLRAPRHHSRSLQPSRVTLRRLFSGHVLWAVLHHSRVPPSEQEVFPAAPRCQPMEYGAIRLPRRHVRSNFAFITNFFLTILQIHVHKGPILPLHVVCRRVESHGCPVVLPVHVPHRLRIPNVNSSNIQHRRIILEGHPHVTLRLPTAVLSHASAPFPLHLSTTPRYILCCPCAVCQEARFMKHVSEVPPASKPASPPVAAGRM